MIELQCKRLDGHRREHIGMWNWRKANAEASATAMRNEFVPNGGAA